MRRDAILLLRNSTRAALARVPLTAILSGLLATLAVSGFRAKISLALVIRAV